MRFALPLICVLSGAVLACDGGTSSSEAMVDRFRPEWRKLEDGSSFAIVSDASAENTLAIRCWPDDVRTFTCLQLSRQAIGMTEVARSFESALPGFIMPFAPTSDGYVCRSTWSYIQEEINRGGTRLTSNRPDGSTQRWDASFVAKYMETNGVQGAGWFKCLEVLDAARGASVAILRNTTIVRSMVEG